MGDFISRFGHLSAPCLKHAGTTPGQYNRQRRPDSRSLKTPGQQRHCTKSDRRPMSNYHITAKPGRRCRVVEAGATDSHLTCPAPHAF